MQRLTLYRRESSDQGTFGTILNWFTGELPWRDNQPDISCIPAGEYEATMAFSEHFRRMQYHLKGVPNRSVIEMHAANLMGARDKGFRAQLNGCIALGEKLGSIDGQKAVLLSRPAVTSFESAMDRKPFILVIKNGYR